MKSRSTATLIVAFLFTAISSCTEKHDSGVDSGESPLFTLLSAAETGVNFRNDLVYDKDFNIYKYRNFYNGGGVAIGDVNNDGLPDVFFTSNMAQNKLYLNRGNFRFEDVSEKAGISGKGSWSTGVAMADVNADGFMDIYVCNSGNPRSTESTADFNRENELFINDGLPGGEVHFTEKARAFGLADRGLTTHAAFFDYDLDGDLDAYILNNSFRAIGSFDLRKNLRYTRDSLGGHKLMRNDGGIFKDVSAEAGILGSVIAFGLGVTVGDYDLDGLQDVYVSNDFFERDYLYRNKGDGSFEEVLERSMRHISAASMGADMADINNDGYPDIFVTDMLPEPDYRMKTTTSFDSPDRFKYTTSCGYYNQFTRNMLHLNNRNGNFSEIACLAGVEATDWSWGALMVDLDNDGLRDIFVANGIAQDLTNQDYLMFASDPVIQQEIIAGGKVDFKRLIDSIPSEKIPNYAFKNLGNLRFKNVAHDWGLDQPGFSNGSAYGDLDNDGDLDLVVNNANMEAFVYRNEADKLLKDNNFLQLELKGESGNTQAFGAKIYVRAGGQTFYHEQMPMRGFQSAMDARPHIGIGGAKTVDTLMVVWPGGKKSTILTAVPASQRLVLRQAEANAGAAMPPWIAVKKENLFSDITAQTGLNWAHQESNFYDWDRDKLLYFSYSTDGPRTAVGDLNGDGADDFFVCGAAGQAGAVFLQHPTGKFIRQAQPSLEKDAAAEDIDAALFDADGDRDLDLYVASGSNEMPVQSPLLADRLYINDGKGNFTKKPDALPGRKPFAGGCVRAADIDGDGDRDLFVGMRLQPLSVGKAVGGFLLINNGKAYFEMQPLGGGKALGQITDAAWNDVDGDGDQDLLVCGEWMPVTVWLNNGSGDLSLLAQALPVNTSGLWRRLVAGDFNGDGRTDFIAGNIGLNSRLEASEKEPLTLFFNDFDANGINEQILCRYNSGMLLPYVLRGDLVSNMPVLKKKYLQYHKYVNQQITDIFRPDQLQGMVRSEATFLESVLLINEGAGKFSVKPLPVDAQFAPMFAGAARDFNGDGTMDAVTGGNFLGVKPEFGYMDADFGLFLQGNKNNFLARRSAETGLNLEGEVRDLQNIKVGGKNCLLVARNNKPLMILEIRR